MIVFLKKILLVYINFFIFNSLQITLFKLSHSFLFISEKIDLAEKKLSLLNKYNAQATGVKYI